MAEMDTSGGGGHKKGPGVKKSKKLSTRVDLTPMGDLGFLVITFFIFTTTMAQATGFKLNLPDDTKKPEDQTKAKESGVMTILLGRDNNVFYYEGQLDHTASNLKSATFGNGDNGIRAAIMHKKVNTPPDDFVVIIKPTDESTYRNVVDILDEMPINGVGRFALQDVTDIETQLVKKIEDSNP